MKKNDFRLVLILWVITSTSVTCSPLNVSRTTPSLELVSSILTSTPVTPIGSSILTLTPVTPIGSKLPSQDGVDVKSAPGKDPDNPMEAKVARQLSSNEGTRFGPLLMVTLDPSLVTVSKSADSVKPVDSLTSDSLKPTENSTAEEKEIIKPLTSLASSLLNVTKERMKENAKKEEEETLIATVEETIIHKDSLKDATEVKKDAKEEETTGDARAEEAKDDAREITPKEKEEGKLQKVKEEGKLQKEKEGKLQKVKEEEEVSSSFIPSFLPVTHSPVILEASSSSEHSPLPEILSSSSQPLSSSSKEVFSSSISPETPSPTPFPSLSPSSSLSPSLPSSFSSPVIKSNPNNISLIGKDDTVRKEEEEKAEEKEEERKEEEKKEEEKTASSSNTSTLLKSKEEEKEKKETSYRSSDTEDVTTLNYGSFLLNTGSILKKSEPESKYDSGAASTDSPFGVNSLIDGKEEEMTTPVIDLELTSDNNSGSAASDTTVVSNVSNQSHTLNDSSISDHHSGNNLGKKSEEKGEKEEKKEEEEKTLKYGHRRSKLDDSLLSDLNGEEDSRDRKDDKSMEGKEMKEGKGKEEEGKNEETFPLVPSLSDEHEKKSLEVKDSFSSFSSESSITNERSEAESKEGKSDANVNEEDREEPVTEAEVSKDESTDSAPIDSFPTVATYAPAMESSNDPIVPALKLASPDAIRPPLTVGIVSSYNPSHGLHLDGDNGQDLTTTETVFESAVPVKESAADSDSVPAEESVPKEEAPAEKPADDTPIDSDVRQPVVPKEEDHNLDSESKDYDDNGAHEHSAGDHSDHDYTLNNHLASSSSSTTIKPEVSSWSHPSLKNMERKRKGKIDDGLSIFDHGPSNSDRTGLDRGQGRPLSPLSGNDLESLSLLDANKRSESSDIGFDFETLIKEKSYHLLPIFLPFLIILLVVLASKSINKVLMMKRSADITRVSNGTKSASNGKTLNGHSNNAFSGSTDLTSVVSLTPSDSNDSNSDAGLKCIVINANDNDIASMTSEKTASTNCSKL